MKISILILLLSFAFPSFGNDTKLLKIIDLRCEYLVNPLGIDIGAPRVSWKISANQRGVKQAGYRIIVSESLEALKSGIGNWWDSGLMESDETNNISYQGIELQSYKAYYWKVGIKCNLKDELIWSDPVFFHTGILHNSDWKARWISTQEEILHNSPILRKTFTLGKKIKRADAFVTACGFYEFYLNGKKVGDHMLDPGITDYRKTILYSSYDVTDRLKSGLNVAGAMLGNGAYNMRKSKGRHSWGDGGSILGNPGFLMQINITYEDGSQEVIVTDESWKYAMGPVTFNNLYGGEDYDARLESGWLSGTFDDRNWKQSTLAKHPGGVLKSQLMPPVKVTATLRPIAQINPSPGIYLFDLGQNIAGWWRITVRGFCGQTIRVRGAETLNDSLFPKQPEAGDKLSIKFKYHSQVWTDYTLKSNKRERYEPRFFYTGFRYIEVTTANGKNPEELKVEGRVAHSSLENNGTFVSSDSLLNKIHRAAVWSQMGNQFSYPTDCPHREKGAYNGDGQVIAETSMHDFQMAPFYTKWVNDMRDSQEANGRIPNTSPTLVGGMGGGVAWGSAYILIPWWMNHYYNDLRILKEHYPTMKKYLFYLKNLGTRDEKPDEPFIINSFDGYWYSLGEWCAPGQSDCPNHAVVNTFYYYYNTLIMSKIAKVLGNKDDAQTFSALADTIRVAFNKKFFNPVTHLYGTAETFQTYQLLALVGELVPEEFRSDVFKTVVDDIIDKRGGHLNTGIIGTKYLWQELVKGNQNNLAFEIATRTTYPGYGYWIKNGSTTLLEEWSGKNSHNHQMFGSISEYFYKYLAGIQSPMEGNTTNGYKHIRLQPFVPNDLASVNGSVETVTGKIVSKWKKGKDSFLYTVSIPANTTGTVVVPLLGFHHIKLTESGIIVWENGSYKVGIPGIVNIIEETDCLIVTIQSGSYGFKLSPG